MKHLFYVVAFGIFAGITVQVKAQTNINIEKFELKAPPKIPLKFIEGLEISPDAVTVSLPPAVEDISENKATFIKITPANASRHNIEQCSSLPLNKVAIMDRDIEYIADPLLYNFIKDWWATRYRYGGTGRKGIDCSAFTGKLLSDVYGITAPRTAKEQFALCEKLTVEDLYEGDLVFFNTRGGISHVGVYLGNNHFAHSSIHGGVTISSLTDPYYSKRFISGGRLAE